MAKKPTRKPAAVKHGFLEYLLLSVLMLVVVVTAWTLYDNGILDTFTELFIGRR
ncbi:MAG: hypothetical protein J4F48_11745 [Nitrospinae bacterium]|nr:hypothetical protein [Nitrospinota bacterium]